MKVSHSCPNVKGLLFLISMCFGTTAALHAQVLSDLGDMAYQGKIKLMGGVNITIPIEHPPMVQLKMKRIAILAENNKSVELADQVRAIFSNDDSITVISRDHMEQIYEEKGFSNGGDVEPGMALAWGKMLTASAVIMVRHYRMSHESHVTPPISGEDYRERITTVRYKVGVKAIDLTTGRLVGAKTLDIASKEVTRALGQSPPKPSKAAMIEKALAKASEEVSRIFLSWTEQKKFTFFKGKKFNMRAAFHELQAQNLEAAAKLARESLVKARTGKGKTAARAKAHHNMAMIHFIKGRYDEALTLLQEANNLKSEKIYRLTQVEIRKAKESRVKLKSIKNAAKIHAKQKTVQKQPAKPKTPKLDPVGQVRLDKLMLLRKKGLVSASEFRMLKKALQSPN